MAMLQDKEKRIVQLLKSVIFENAAVSSSLNFIFDSRFTVKYVFLGFSFLKYLENNKCILKLSLHYFLTFI